MKKNLIIAIITVLFFSCDKDNRRKGDAQLNANISVIAHSSNKIKQITPTINVFIENSGSMDGYVVGNTEFKGAIRDLLVLLKYHYDEKNIKLFSINQQINTLKSDPNVDIASFASNLETKWRKGQKNAQWQSTNLNQIFKMILDRTDNNTISILFSDCIFSIRGSTNAVSLLQDEKTLTKDAFLSKWKKDKVKLASTIVKMKSKFNGKYYPFTGAQNGYMINGTRPYYICVLANQDVLADFNKKIELKTGTVEGFEKKYTLLSERTKNVYYTVLQSTLNKGRFRPDNSKGTKNYIHGIKDVELTKGVGKIQFAVAVDFSDIQVEADYLTNSANYKVTTQNFIIKKIAPIDSIHIHSIDKNRIKASNSNPTHVLVLEAKSKLVSDVKFVLEKKIPQWIFESNTEDDTSYKKTLGKTFGLYYWVAGISEAYQTIFPNNNYYFDCTVTIN